MSLANLDDINSFLPQDKFRATDGNPKITLFQIDVERLVKGYLGSVFSATELNAWADPATTPNLIQSVAGRLIAAFYYRDKVSEQVATHEERAYPQRLYNEAMLMLDGIRLGKITLAEVSELPGTAFDTDYFYPNDLEVDAPKFTMDMRF
jgi:hypothetical protein